jgi:hypothetical protein
MKRSLAQVCTALSQQDPQAGLIIAIVFSICFAGFTRLAAADADFSVSYIVEKAASGCFPVAEKGKVVPVFASSGDFPGVLRILDHFQDDIQLVTGLRPELRIDNTPDASQILLIGTLGKNPLIDHLVANKKLDASNIHGKRETFLIEIIENPFAGVEQALVITGSDKRGTIYGMFDFSEKIGISPWHWWADVPAKRKSDLWVKPGSYSSGEPKITYRGIFINDEAPALSGWANEKFGGFNARFYAHVFELILRLKGNFLWPAMWGRAFYVDDPENPRLADELGVVIGTSHHEPMMRAHAEWAMFGDGSWNYQTNETRLQQFWTEGIKRMDGYESIVTLAMRGDGDKPMSEEADIALLQKIVRDQRKILEEVTGEDITTIPQVWALYKEVQDYYDRGMRVPDDITLLLCDDNWGNIRKLPKPDDKPREGGYGIYYHYDYVGGPRNYKWLNTNQISRVWEQMHLAYAYGADRIWIVNVGDIKPMEFPISFFLSYAWDPDNVPAASLPEYTRTWAEEQFGAQYAGRIADILTAYTRYNSRRKPELLSPDTYSLVNYREAEKVVSEYNQLVQEAAEINQLLPPGSRDAFYQLLMHPVQACSNLNELYVTVGKNHLYAGQGRILTNTLAEKARELFKKDAAISHYYNEELAGGKWHHMMDQTHIGYTSWQQPDENIMPEVKIIDNPIQAKMGVAVEGSSAWWPGPAGTDTAVTLFLPEFDPYNRQTFYIEIFNRGKIPFKYAVEAAKPCVQIDSATGMINTQKRIQISVDWKRTLPGKHRIPLTIKGPGRQSAVVIAVIENRSVNAEDIRDCFVESNGYIAVEAAHYTQALNTRALRWLEIPGLGRTLSGMILSPVTFPVQTPGDDTPHLEYRMYFFQGGNIKVQTYLSPTLNFHNSAGLCYGISFDDQPPLIVNMHKDFTFSDWEESVRRNINVVSSEHMIVESGPHVLKFWAVDPGIVLQRIVVETGDVRPSYLGPPESFFVKVDSRTGTK